MEAHHHYRRNRRDRNADYLHELNPHEGNCCPSYPSKANLRAGNPSTGCCNKGYPRVAYLNADCPRAEHLHEPGCCAGCPGKGSRNVLYPRGVYRYVERSNEVDPHEPDLHKGCHRSLCSGAPGFHDPGLHGVDHGKGYRCEGRLSVLCHCAACLDKASPRAVDRSASSFYQSEPPYLACLRVESHCELPDLNVRYIFHHNPSDTCYAEQCRLIPA